jgi:hypothetical protein
MLDDQTFGFNEPDALELVQLIGNADGEHNNWHGVPGDGGSGIVMKTPVGGIAARSGTTVSSATCTQWDRSGSTMSAGTATYTVYNLSTTAVAATVFIVAVQTNIGWVAVWEDC